MYSINCSPNRPIDSMNMGKSSQLGKHGFGSLYNLMWTCLLRRGHPTATFVFSQLCIRFIRVFPKVDHSVNVTRIVLVEYTIALDPLLNQIFVKDLPTCLIWGGWLIKSKTNDDFFLTEEVGDGTQALVVAEAD